MISFLTNLPGPGSWEPGGEKLEGDGGCRAEKRNCPLGNEGTAGCLASVQSWILSLCEVHGLETQSSYWDRVCTSRTVLENTGFIRRNISKCP